MMAANGALTKKLTRRIVRTVFLGIATISLNIVYFRHGLTIHGAHPLLTLVVFFLWWSLYANLKGR